MPTSAEIELLGQHLLLHPLAVAFWQERQTLLLADLHLGKVTHFRRNGAAAPALAAAANFERLISLLLEFDPERVLFLGDLFHSAYNTEWEDFQLLRSRFPDMRFELVQGNHDVLDASVFRQADIRVYEQPLQEGPFLFSHHPLSDWPQECYNLAGHIHPGVRLNGSGKQSLRLPCFCFGSRQGLLPAFGAFTGLGLIQPKEGDRVFVLAEDKVIGPLAVKRPPSKPR